MCIRDRLGFILNDLLNNAERVGDVGAMIAHTLGIVQQIVEDEACLLYTSSGEYFHTKKRFSPQMVR